MQLEFTDLRDLAERAARRGGEIVRGAGDGLQAKEKGAGDYVTEADVASERAVAEVLLAGAPNIPVVGEEEGGSRGERYWVVDPLDGTTNFIHGFPAVGVSVALVENGRPVVGAVHAPFLGETYVGAQGSGAWLLREGLEAVRLSVSTRAPEHAIVATGFPFRRKQVLDRYLGVLRRALERFEDLRRPGAASLDLAWVAAGVFEGFFELGLSSWDVAAGGLLIEEAGGVVSDWSGAGDWLSGDILAGSRSVHDSLLQICTG